MPELPDVEGCRRFFDRYGTGKRVEKVNAEPDVLRNTTPQELGPGSEWQPLAQARAPRQVAGVSRGPGQPGAAFRDDRASGVGRETSRTITSTTG